MQLIHTFRNHQLINSVRIHYLGTTYAANYAWGDDWGYLREDPAIVFQKEVMSGYYIMRTRE
jgi:hypothetical protein